MIAITSGVTRQLPRTPARPIAPNSFGGVGGGLSRPANDPKGTLRRFAPIGAGRFATSPRRSPTVVGDAFSSNWVVLTPRPRRLRSTPEAQRRERTTGRRPQAPNFHRPRSRTLRDGAFGGALGSFAA